MRITKVTIIIITFLALVSLAATANEFFNYVDLSCHPNFGFHNKTESAYVANLVETYCLENYKDCIYLCMLAMGDEQYWDGIIHIQTLSDNPYEEQPWWTWNVIRNEHQGYYPRAFGIPAGKQSEDFLFQTVTDCKKYYDPESGTKLGDVYYYDRDKKLPRLCSHELQDKWMPYWECLNRHWKCQA